MLMLQPTRQLNSVLVKPAGPDCNLGCGYCFYRGKQALFPSPQPHRMNATVLEETVRQMMRDGGQEVVFSWQGGEPTLMGVEFFERAVGLQREYGQDGQVVGNGLQTNGLLIDDRWCRFLRSARFLVGLSIDGPPDVHDHYRRAVGGQTTWQRVDEARKRLLDAGVAVNALTVLTDASVRCPGDVYESLKTSGLRHMQFIPCLEHDPDRADRAAPFSVGPEALGAFLCDVFDRWLDDFRHGEPTTVVRWFESVFATYVDVPPPECTLLGECGTYVVVEHNGDVFSCDFFVESDWKLGNVLQGELVQMLNSAAQVGFGRRKSQLPRACRQCRWLPHCGGGCPKERWGHPAGDGRSYFCDAYQTFFSHAHDRFETLAASWRRRHGLGGGARANRGAAGVPGRL